nr:MAG TPA: tail assembly chaperone protein [Caudoviricetes sp.]
MVTDSAGAAKRQRVGAGKKHFGCSKPLELFRKALHRPSERQAVCH